MFDFIKQAKEMQGKLKEIKDELSREEFTGEAGGVIIRVSGDMEVREVKIDPKTNLSNIAEFVKDAASRALKDAKQGAARKMGKLTGGLNLPGLF